MGSVGNTISESYQGPAVDIAVWICFTISGLAILTKILTKIGRQPNGIWRLALGSDDLFMIFALLTAAGQSLAVSRQVAAGLGTYYYTFQASHGVSYEKAGYTSQFLYVFTIVLAKVVTFLFALKLDSKKHLPLSTYIGMLLTGVWFLTSIFLVAFQCYPPFWKIYSGKCISQPTFWTYVEVFNISLDIFLAILLCLLIRDILKTRTKYVLWVAFSLRALAIPAVAIRLYYLYHLNYGQIGHEEGRAAIATAVAMNTSIMITCIPFLKPLMKQLQPGWATSDVRHGVGYNLTYSKGSRSILANSGRFPAGSVVASDDTIPIHPIGIGATLDSIDLSIHE